jgi:gamma-glutamyltranspeptidase/glutathione hydrolase/leukotriene-C4 hydrolase
MNRSKLTFVFLKAILLVLLIGAVIFAVVVSSRAVKPKTGGAVVTNGIECAAIGRSIMERGGSVADVAVSTIICEG